MSIIHQQEERSSEMQPLIAVLATLALVYRAWSKKSLTPVGMVTAVVTAVVHTIHPWSVFFILLALFFLLGNAVTKVRSPLVDANRILNLLPTV